MNQSGLIGLESLGYMLDQFLIVPSIAPINT